MQDDERTELIADPISPQSGENSGRPSGSNPVSARPPSLSPGSILFESYEIVGVLGAGGMGDVYRARHLSLNEFRAIKVMNPSLETNDSAIEHFHREARTLLEVFHPAIVRCHDLLQDEYGRFFLIMELVEGVTLAERHAERPLSVDEVRTLYERLAGGLAEIHAKDVIHRDIAPDNIMLPEGRIEHAKLIDFGIAKRLQADDQTRVGEWKGKLRFASPEQFGYFGGVIDKRSDYYSMGLMLCAVANVNLGDMGSSYHDAIQARQQLPNHHTRIPAELRDVLVPLIAFDPNDRPDTLESDFRASRSSGKSKRATHPASGSRSLVRAALALLVGISAAAGIAYFVLDPFTEQTTGQTRQGGAATEPPTIEQSDVTSPRPEPIEVPTEEPRGLPAVEAPDSFSTLRQRLKEISGRPGTLSSIAIDPNPVLNGDAYHLRIMSDCDCYPMVFLINDEEAQVDLLYPNAFDPPILLNVDDGFAVPSTDMYDFEAVAGAGDDRIKLILLSEMSSLAPTGSSWSATADEAPRVQELASFLDELVQLDPNEWSSAETTLMILP